METRPVLNIYHDEVPMTRVEAAHRFDNIIDNVRVTRFQIYQVWPDAYRDIKTPLGMVRFLFYCYSEEEKEKVRNRMFLL